MARKPDKRDEARDELISYLLSKGFTKADIARKLKITPQRVGQLVDRINGNRGI